MPRKSDSKIASNPEKNTTKSVTKRAPSVLISPSSLSAMNDLNMKAGKAAAKNIAINIAQDVRTRIQTERRSFFTEKSAEKRVTATRTPDMDKDIKIELTGSARR